MPTKPGLSELYRDDPDDIFTTDSALERPGTARAGKGSDRGDQPGPAERSESGEAAGPDRRPDPVRPGTRDDHRPGQDGQGVDAGTNGVRIDRSGSDRSGGGADRPTALGPDRSLSDADRSKALSPDRSGSDADLAAGSGSDRSGGGADRPTAPQPGRDAPRSAPLDAAGPPARHQYTDRREDLLVHPPEVGRRRITLDAPLDDGLTPRALFTGFDPTRANRSDLREDEAIAHLRDRVRAQPRLVAVMDQQRCVQRAYAIFDSGVFHGTVRHEGGMRDLDHERRVLLREDPAQTDDAKRARGMDGYRKGRHLCPAYSTSIEDPVAYLVALVRGLEHPDVQAALASPISTDEQPDPVKLPIVQLLGPESHMLCRGYKLVGDDLERAVDDRDAWLKAGWRGEPRHNLKQPVVEPISTFDGGVIEFRFGHSRARDRYEVISMFPVPPPDRPDPRARGQRP